jgi:hypothetical protein
MKTHRVRVKQVSADAYNVYRDGRLLIFETATPFADTAKNLLASGAQPHDILNCEIEGHAVYHALTQRIGKLASTDS